MNRGRPRQHNTHRMNVHLQHNMEQLEQLAGVDGGEAVLVVERDDYEDTEGSFSPEALTELRNCMEAWVISRILRQWNQSGTAPKKMTVRVRVVAN